jgi:hypothetical protein
MRGLLGIGVTQSAGVDEPANGILFLMYGQSNAKRRATKVSLSYPANLYRFNGYMETSDRPVVSEVAPLDGAQFASLIAYDENSVDAEGWAPGFASVTDAHTILAYTPAVGARDWRELRPGQGPWSNLVQAIQRGVPLVLANGAETCDLVMIWDHGEADADTTPPGGGGSETAVTQAEYLGILTQLVAQYHRWVQLALNDISLEPDIWGSFPVATPTDGQRNVQNAHLQAAQTVNGYNLIGPKYPYLHDTDGVHILGSGKRFFAEYAALRIVQGGLPVHMTSATRTAAVIVVAFDTISGNLVIDTTAVPETTTAYANSKNGFEVLLAGVAQTISTVTVATTNATITLSGDPGGVVVVRYAQQTWPGGTQTVTGVNSKIPRGNIRDSGSTLSTFDGTTALYNWAVPQSISTNV